MEDDKPRECPSTGKSDGGLEMRTVQGAYKFVSSVGKGSCAIVYKGSCLTPGSPHLTSGEAVAIKTVLHGLQGTLTNASSISSSSSSRQSMDEAGGLARGTPLQEGESTSRKRKDAPSSSSSSRKKSLFGSFISKAASLASSSNRGKRGSVCATLDDLDRGPEMEPEDRSKIEKRKRLKAEAAVIAARLMTDCEAGLVEKPPAVPKSCSPDSCDESKLQRYAITREFNAIRKYMQEAYGCSPSRVCSRMRKEISIHKVVNHPYVTKLYDYRMEIDKTHLILEYCEESLYGFLLRARPEGLDLRETLKLAAHLGSALAYLHDKGIVHRDVKPENVLLKQCGRVSSLRLCDFGLATTYFEWARLPNETGRPRIIDPKTAEEFLETLWYQDKDFEDHYDGLLREYCGSPRYAAPEIVRQTPYRGPEVDSWSFGTVLAVASTCRMIPLVPDVARLFKFMVTDDPVPIPSFVDPALKDPLGALFCKNPLKRATCQRVAEWASECLDANRCLPFEADPSL